MSLSPADMGKPTHPAADTRQRILEAAMRCFAESGFHNASMQQICAAAQMSPGGVYRYFASKDQIIAAIFEFVHSRNTQYFERMAAESVTLETFADVGFSCLRELTQGPERGLFCEVFAEAQRNPNMRGIIEAKFQRMRELLRGTLLKLQAAGEVDPALDVEAIVTILLAIGDGLIVRLRRDNEMPFEAFWPSLKSMIMRMLQPAGKPPAQEEKVSS